MRVITLGGFKKRFVAWLEECQRREVDRLHKQALRLKREVEQKTGKPHELTAQERRRLAEKAKGIDPETLRRISVLDPEQLMSDQESTENRYPSSTEPLNSQGV